MAIDYTTNEIVSSVKRRITVPTSQNFFLPDNIVSYANDEMHSTVIPSIISVMEEYFVTSEDVAIVSTQNEYTIPSRAVGGMLRDVVIVDSQGGEISLPRLAPETTKEDSVFFNVKITGIMIRDDKVVLYPNASIFGDKILRFKYMRRPNNLIIVSKSGKIVNVNTLTNEVTLSNMPTFFTTSLTYDIIKGTPIFTSIKDDQVITNIAGNTMTFTSLPTGIAAGQYVAESGSTPIPQIPYEAHHVLSQFTSARMLEATGDKKNSEVIMAVAKEMLESLLKILTPRIEGTPKKINNRSGIFQFTAGYGYPGWV